MFIEENIRCEYTDKMNYVCYCFLTIPQTNVVRAVTMNGTDCSLRDECLVDNGGCAHVCTDLRDGFQCSCNRGPPSVVQNLGDPDVYTLSANGYDCIDIDECASRSFVDQFCASPSKCVNTPGYYTCIRNTVISKSGLVDGPGKYLFLATSVIIGQQINQNRHYSQTLKYDDSTLNLLQHIVLSKICEQFDVYFSHLVTLYTVCMN